MRHWPKLWQHVSIGKLLLSLKKNRDFRESRFFQWRHVIGKFGSLRYTSKRIRHSYIHAERLGHVFFTTVDQEFDPEWEMV